MVEDLKNIIEQLQKDRILPNKLAEEIIKSNNINYKNQGVNALHYAVSRGHLEDVKKLIALEADINQDTYASQTILHLAVKYNKLEIVKYLLEEVSPHLTNEFLGKTNRHGETVLHSAARTEKPEILKSLLKRDFLKNKILDENYYGWTAIDIACGQKNDDAVKILLGNENLTRSELEKLPHYGKPFIKVSQNKLNKKLMQFLTLTGRNSADIMDSDGYCGGWEFLYLMSKDKDEFFATLNLIVDWDGTEESLKNTQLNAHFKEKYKKIFPKRIEQPGQLLDIFEQVANNLIIFQMTNSPNIHELNLNMKQNSRAQQFEFLKNSSDDRKLEQLGFFKANLNKAQLIELLELCSRYRGARIDIGGAEHGVALQISEEGFFVVDYYDPNANNKLKPFTSAESLADYIIKTKYKALDKPSEPMDITFHIFKIYPNSKDTSKIEKTSPASKPVNNSANQFSDLHYAVLENDAEKVRALLQNSDDNIVYTKDAHGVSVLKRALSMGNPEILHWLAKSLDTDKLMDEIDWENATDNPQLQNVIELIKSKIKPSEASAFETKILTRALSTRSIHLVNKLLDNGLVLSEKLRSDPNIPFLMNHKVNPYEFIKFFNHKNNTLDLPYLLGQSEVFKHIMHNKSLQELLIRYNAAILNFITKLIENGANLDPTDVVMLGVIVSNEKLAETYREHAVKRNYDFSTFARKTNPWALSSSQVMDKMNKKERTTIVNFLSKIGVQLAYASYLSLTEAIEFNTENSSNTDTGVEKHLATKIKWELQSVPLDITELKKFIQLAPNLAERIVIPLITKYLAGINSVEQNKILNEFKKSGNELLTKILIKSNVDTSKLVFFAPDSDNKNSNRERIQDNPKHDH